MKKLLTERALEYDADDILCSEEKYGKICQLGFDLGFSMHELIDEIHYSPSSIGRTHGGTETRSSFWKASLLSLSPSDDSRKNKVSGKRTNFRLLSTKYLKSSLLRVVIGLHPISCTSYTSKI
jgi:hypothetical protein